MILIGAIAGFAAAAETGWARPLACRLARWPAWARRWCLPCLRCRWPPTRPPVGNDHFGIGLSAFIGQHYVSYACRGSSRCRFALSDIPVIGPVLFHQDAVVYLSLAAFALVAWTLAKTRLGLLLKAVGESPEAAHAIGYPVLAIRYGAVVLFGGGQWPGWLGPICPPCTPRWVQNMSAGRGWIAVALVVFCRLEAGPPAAGAYLFGAVTILQFHAQGLGIALPVQLLAALPYLATIVVLVLISRDRRLLQLNLRRRWASPTCLRAAPLHRRIVRLARRVVRRLSRVGRQNPHLVVPDCSPATLGAHNTQREANTMHKTLLLASAAAVPARAGGRQASVSTPQWPAAADHRPPWRFGLSARPRWKATPRPSSWARLYRAGICDDQGRC